MAIDLTGWKVLGYRVTDTIREGGKASVWCAEHTLMHKTVAIKVLDPVLARVCALLKRFIYVARIQDDLTNLSIVTIENFSTDPLAMVMEFVEGHDVIDREVDPIPSQTALPFMLQLLDVVGFAHDQIVTHRDIKPSCILESDNGQVKVMDIGISKILGASRMTKRDSSMGTAAYMWSEQIEGAKSFNTHRDIYSIRVTFYEMLAGRPPFEGDPETDSDFDLRLTQVSVPPPSQSDTGGCLVSRRTVGCSDLCGC